MTVFSSVKVALAEGVATVAVFPVAAIVAVRLSLNSRIASSTGENADLDLVVCVTCRQGQCVAIAERRSMSFLRQSSIRGCSHRPLRCRLRE